MDQVAAQSPARLIDADTFSVHQRDVGIDVTLEREGANVQDGLSPRHVRVVP